MTKDTRKVVQAEARGQASGDLTSALRGMHVLDLLGRWGGARTQLRIAGELDIPKSSLTQVLKTPLRHDDVAFDAQTRAFSLGPAILGLASRARASRALADVSGPLPEAEGDDDLARAQVTRFAENSLPDADAARDKLEPIRADAFARVVEEFTPGIGGIAMALDAQDRALASLRHRTSAPGPDRRPARPPWIEPERKDA